jgi:hypothetical protein
MSPAHIRCFSHISNLETTAQEGDATVRFVQDRSGENYHTDDAAESIFDAPQREPLHTCGVWAWALLYLHIVMPNSTWN